ncbi:polysaccharide lyase family 8 super-sandwich domain-containing protein [Streptomyces himalayensis]|uniref:Polysaccharide lyase 8 family protein n=1 Tax=Streptomyces himalayensis subsp. himalayensis TaxID=2756131 RepID=A0A7W0DIX7_9ACTN|nr:polysaccharide lyase family 8 super-sandwich domain-containing protein [Streptomyces himalayensis]MBA2945893.1 polysaccharide lyase 8 family protein [Streptomyces himalayensis subsp. himalayensis]
MSQISRRRLLRIAALTGVGLGVTSVSRPAYAADEYDVLRERWVSKTIIGSGYDASAEPFAGQFAQIGATASTLQSSMAPASSSLWPELPIGSAYDSSNVTSCFTRLRTMAQAWALPGTGLTGDTGLLADIVSGLDWMNAGAYTPTTTTYDNWWDWQIGAPKPLLDTMALVYGSLSSSQISGCLSAVDHFVPDSAVASYSGSSTGGNRVDLCQVLILRGILGKSSAKITTGRGALSPVFPLVRDDDGFYADGSFLQHHIVPYVGTYGQILVNGLAGLLVLLTGSTWAVTDTGRQVLFDAAIAATAPFLFNGLMMDGQSGRAISRGIKSAGNPLGIQQDDHTRGHAMISGLLLLAEAASAEEAAKWKAMAKGWLQRDYWSPYLSDRSLQVPALARGQAVLDDTSITPAAEPVVSQVFGAMDRATHRRAGWALAVAMCSARTTFYETGNGENLRGWHTNSGMTYWWGDSFGNGQYSDAFWPTVDPYRLPGTTVSRKPLADAEGGSFGRPVPTGAVWVGGATDGTYSAVGQDTRGLTSTLAAKKSWFCLDDQVVCLGAGITSSDGYAVETTIDNRNLGSTSSAAFTVDGTAQPTTLGWAATFTGASWAALKGFGGYVFPGGATFKALRESRTGSWHDINTDASTTSLTRPYVTLWFDHGTDPGSGSYAYILLPGATSTTTATRAASPTVRVLANTANVQAITDSATAVTAANFFTAGTAGPITVSKPCSVLMRESGGTLGVTVADPTRAATTVTVTIDRSGYVTASGDAEVQVTGLDPITLVVEVGGSQGASRTITFGTGSAVTAGRSRSLAPTADAYVRDGSYAATNYGTDTTLVVKNTTAGYARRSFLKFDVSGLPAAPRRAVLWVYGRTADNGGTQSTVSAYSASNDSWTETGLTWNSQPALGTVLSSRPIGSVNDWVPLDVTAHVRSQYSGDGTATIALAQQAAGLVVLLNSRENAANQPFLHLIAD